MPIDAPAACHGGFEEKSRPGTDVEQAAACRTKDTFEAFKPVGLRKFGPLLVFAGMGEKSGFFVRVIGLAIFALKLARIGQRHSMAKAAHRAMDDVVALDAGHARTLVSLPGNVGFRTCDGHIAPRR